MDQELGDEYREWEARRKELLGRDAAWRMAVYRLARFAADRAWKDVERLGADRRTRDVASQLWRALGGICASLMEGYSRSSGADRVRFYEYALGSARESREWYLQGEPVIGAERVALAIAILDRIVRLLLHIIPRERRRQIRPDASRADDSPAKD